MITARIALHADRSNGQQPAGIAARDGSDRFRAQAADGQARPWERMTMQELAGYAQLRADLANFIFIKRSQRFNDAAGVDQLLNAGDAIVVSLDDVGFRAATRFDGIGINSSLP